MRQKIITNRVSFLEEFKQLAHTEPRIAAYNFRNKNCSYSNFLVGSKNCYHCFNSGNLHNCSYCYLSNFAKNSMDLNNCEGAINCYECSDSSNIKNCSYLTNCYNCLECELCEDLLRSKYCFGCVGLYKKKFHIFNVDYKNKSAYQTELERIHSSFSKKEIIKKYEQLRKTVPRINMQLVNSEHCEGDYLFDCRGDENCFNCNKTHLSAYNAEVDKGYFCIDVNNSSTISDAYDCIECTDVHFASHCFFVANSKYMILCTHCFNCENCIGCVNLRDKQFCILNKQYTEEEYRKKAPEIIKEIYANGSILLTDFYSLK